MVDTQPAPPAKNNTKKILIWGCGGCLVLLLLAGLVTLALGWMGCNAAMQVSNQAVKTVFGESFDAGKHGYAAIGIPTGQPGMENVIMLTNMGTGMMLFAVETDASKMEGQAGEEVKMDALMEQVSAKMGGEMDVKNMQMANMKMVRLPNGKQFMLTLAKLGNVDTDGQVPGAFALLPLGQEHMMMMFASNPKGKTQDANANFASYYSEMEKEIVKLITESTLADRLSEDMSQMDMGGMDMSQLQQAGKQAAAHNEVDVRKLQEAAQKMSEGGEVDIEKLGAELEKYAQQAENAQQ